MNDSSTLPRFSKIIGRFFIAGIVYGAGVFVIWMVAVSLNIPQAVTNPLCFMAVVSGGALCTRWINDAWLAYASTHRVYCHVIFLVPLYIFAALFLAIGTVSGIGALLQPAKMASVFFEQEMKSAAEREADVLLAEFDRHNVGRAERLRRLEEEREPAVKRVLDQFKWRLIGLNSIFGAFGLWFLYSGLLGLNVAKRSIHAARFRPAAVGDIRDQVLYFRSFAADAQPGIREGLLASFSLKTEEELLAGSFLGTRRGFFALGRPGEPLPELGARRMYFSHEEWKENVASMLPDAGLVILQPGATPSIRWEIEQILSVVDPLRFAIWIPPALKTPFSFTLRKFLESVESLFPHGVLSDNVSIAEEPTLANFVVFDENWMPGLASTFLTEKHRKESKRKTQDALLSRVLIARATGRLRATIE